MVVGGLSSLICILGFMSIPCHIVTIFVLFWFCYLVALFFFLFGDMRNYDPTAVIFPEFFYNKLKIFVLYAEIRPNI